MSEKLGGLYLNRMDLWVEQSAVEFNPFPTTPGRRITLDRMETHHGIADLKPRSVVPSPVSRLQELLKKKSRGPYGAIIFSQSYPDCEPLSAPLQRCLEFHPMEAREVLGLSHLEETAGLEAMVCMDWLLDEEEDGLVLLTDIFPYEHQKESGIDIVACLEVSRKPGAVRIDGINRGKNGLGDADSMRMCDPWLAFAKGCETRAFNPGEGVLLTAGIHKSITLSLDLLEYPVIQRHLSYQINESRVNRFAWPMRPAEAGTIRV